MKSAAVLDVGSSKIVCLCGSFINLNGMTVHGVSVCPYVGYQNGVFSDHRALHTAVVDAVRSVEQDTRQRIHEIAVSVPAPFCKLVLGEATLPVRDKSRRVTAADIDELISASLDKAESDGYVLMHSTPVRFTLNGETSAATPIGVKADEVSVQVSHMYVQQEFVRTLESILSAIDVELSMCMSSQLCNALTVIPEKERVRPAVLIDVGYTHTDVSIVESAALTAVKAIDVGGKHFASDLGFGLDVPLETAEQVKRRYVFMQEPLSSTEIVRTPTGPKRVDHKVIRLIMEARAEEFCALLREAITTLGVSLDANPITYVTGGGFAMQKGGMEYLKSALQLAVKRDTPWVQDMDTPNYTSAFAALDFVLRANEEVLEPSERSGGKLTDRLKNFFIK